MKNADVYLQPGRPGGSDALALPSRINDELHYRSGAVTRMDGSVLKAAPVPVYYQPSRQGRSAVERMAYSESIYAR